MQQQQPAVYPAVIYATFEVMRTALPDFADGLQTRTLPRLAPILTDLEERFGWHAVLALVHSLAMIALDELDTTPRPSGMSLADRIDEYEQGTLAAEQNRLAGWTGGRSPR